jgi:hypothetical protein
MTPIILTEGYNVVDGGKDYILAPSKSLLQSSNSEMAVIVKTALGGTSILLPSIASLLQNPSIKFTVSDGDDKASVNNITVGVDLQVSSPVVVTPILAYTDGVNFGIQFPQSKIGNSRTVAVGSTITITNWDVPHDGSWVVASVTQDGVDVKVILTGFTGGVAGILTDATMDTQNATGINCTPTYVMDTDCAKAEFFIDTIPTVISDGEYGVFNGNASTGGAVVPFVKIASITKDDLNAGNTFVVALGGKLLGKRVAGAYVEVTEAFVDPVESVKGIEYSFTADVDPNFLGRKSMTTPSLSGKYTRQMYAVQDIELRIVQSNPVLTWTHGVCDLYVQLVDFS